MSTARLQKQEESKQLRAELSEAPHAILVDFQRLNVEGATNLRRKLRESDAHLKVVKNTTALRAIEGLPLAALEDVFVGQTAIAYTGGDVVTPVMQLAPQLCCSGRHRRGSDRRGRRTLRAVAQ